MRLLLTVLIAALAASAQQYRAFWADAFHAGFKTPAQVDQLVADLVTARANAIFAEVRLDGASYYLKTLEVPADDRDYPQTFDSLAYLIEKAHAQGIEVHAWFPVYPTWRSATPPANPNHIWRKHGPGAQGDDMWVSIASSGKVSTSFDPGHPGVLRYLVDVFTDPLKHYDLDGIHLDYIRYPDDADYGWNPKSIQRYERLFARTGIPQPADSQWSEFRRLQVTQLVRQTYLRAIALKPQVKVTAATISWGNGPASDAGFRSTDAFRRVFQDWRGWLEEGILDVAMPMNYFREQQFPQFLDRWTEFMKDRQYGRMTLSGLGNYLNTLPDSLAQLRRVLLPSAAGNRLGGVSIYSYANTTSGTPPANAEFYRAVADFFGAPATPPVLPWKSAPERGHVAGRVTVDGGPEWLPDGVSVVLESDSLVRRTMTDATGFFGFVDVPPGLYALRLERGGVELLRTSAKEVAKGAVTEFEVFFKASDFDSAAPRLAERSAAAAPGEIITLPGSLLSSDAFFATQVPLPVDLGQTTVFVNGQAAPLFHVMPESVRLHLPFTSATQWSIVVRRAGLLSAALELPAIAANPIITGVRRVGEYLEIYATGLGAVDPPVPAGTGGPAAEPLPRVARNVTVLIDGQELAPLYAGLEPYNPGSYQVNVRVPDGVTPGEIRLKVGDAVSPPAPRN